MGYQTKSDRNGSINMRNGRTLFPKHRLCYTLLCRNLKNTHIFSVCVECLRGLQLIFQMELIRPTDYGTRNWFLVLLNDVSMMMILKSTGFKCVND